MFQEHFAGSDLLIWPLVALGLFFAAFVAVLVKVAWGFRRGTRMDHVAHLPLEPDANAPPSTGRGLEGKNA